MNLIRNTHICVRRLHYSNYSHISQTPRGKWISKDGHIIVISLTFFLLLFKSDGKFFFLWFCFWIPGYFHISRQHMDFTIQQKERTYISTYSDKAMGKVCLWEVGRSASRWHYSLGCRLKSQVTRLLVQQFVQVDHNEYIKDPQKWVSVRKSIDD